MTYNIVTWEDLADKTIFSGLTEAEINELGLKFKSGKNMAGLVEKINESSAQPPFSTEAMVARRENILKEFLDGDLST